MKTLREKISFVLTGLAYLLLHLGTNSTVDDITPASIVSGTVQQLLTTAPYCFGFTIVAVGLIRYFTGGKWPPWDRIVRIFFTVGIIFGFFFNLYNIGYRAEQERLQKGDRPVSESRFSPDDIPRAPSYWA